MRRLAILAIFMICAAVGISAQTSSENSGRSRRHHVEDKHATLRVNKITSPEADASFAPNTAYSYALDDFKPGVVRVGPRTTYLKPGLRTDEVIRLMGKPAAITQRTEKDVTVTVYEFQRGDGQLVIAEFESGLLARSRTETREKSVEADQ